MIYLRVWEGRVMHVQTEARGHCQASDNGRLQLSEIFEQSQTYVRDVVRAQSRIENPTARLIVAGAIMAAIRHRDPDQWEAFATHHPVRVKGANAHYRAVATILWKSKTAEPVNRERISAYGKAICVVHEQWKKSPTRIDTALVRKVVKARGLRGLCELYAKEHGKPKGSSGKVSVNVRDTATVYVVLPDRRVMQVDAALARSLIAKVLQCP